MSESVGAIVGQNLIYLRRTKVKSASISVSECKRVRLAKRMFDTTSELSSVRDRS